MIASLLRPSPTVTALALGLAAAALLWNGVTGLAWPLIAVGVAAALYAMTLFMNVLADDDATTRDARPPLTATSTEET